MKWVNLWIKYFADYTYTNCLQFNTTTVILHKSKKYQGVKEKKHDFEMSMPSYKMCCTKMVHFIGVPSIKSCSSLLTPHDFTLLPKIIVIVSNRRQFCIGIICTIINS